MMYLTYIKWGLIAAAVAGIFFWGWHLGSQSVQVKWDKQEAAQAALVATQQSKILAQLQAQQKAATDAENMYEHEIASANARADTFAASLHNYLKARARPVPSGPVTAPVVNGPAAEPAGDPKLEQLSGTAVEACGSDAAQLAALEAWVSNVLH
jgi:hypothetical protein